ncbi:MAG: M48 family metallopeptidase [Burkholderiales bacterium]
MTEAAPHPAPIRPARPPAIGPRPAGPRLRQRLAAGLLVAAAWLPAGAQQQAPQDGVRVGNPSSLAKLVPAEQLERAAAEQYGQMMRGAAAKGALLPPEHPQVQRARRIARAIIEQAGRFNARAGQWRWEVNVLADGQINAFCMPGGKIGVYTGILDKLKLTDDELAMVMGHEVAHALREHARERAAKGSLTEMGAGLVTSIFGMGDLGRMAVGAGAQLLTLSFSRDNETDADLVGLDLAARAGYDPRAAVRVWEKMSAAAKGAPPQWLSTHPASTTRINEIRRHLGETLPLYARTRGKPVDSLPPYTSNWGDPIP